MEVQHNYSLQGLNSFGLDSRTAYYASPPDMESLTRLLGHDDYGQLPLLVLGEGSNILFRNGFTGLVLQPALKGIEVVEETDEEVLVAAGASENWDRLVAYTLEKGWYGLENLSLIPGSVGASPVQNIGAYGVELRDRLAWLEAWDLQEHRLVRMDSDACEFGYRSSIFKGEAAGRYMITRVGLQLSRRPDLQLDYGNVRSEFTRAKGNTPQDLRRVIMGIRRSRLPDPLEYGNAGSFFKNPLVDRVIFSCIRVEYPDVPFYPADGNQKKIPAAWLIEKCGWKGKRLGNVGTWPAQALVIVNYGGATGQEIFDFSEQIIEDVERSFGITLEREVTVI